MLADRIQKPLNHPVLPWALVASVLAATAIVFRRPIADLVDVWLTSAEYNYGPMVPAIALLMLWRDNQRSSAPVTPSWTGVAIMAMALVARLLGRAAGVSAFSNIALVIACAGLVIALVGLRRTRDIWPGLVFLIFALPLSDTAQFDLTWRLQLLSSQGGVAIINFVGIPVFREGNIIDMGLIQLQVAEACSGLRYLFPLATFGFLCAYLFDAHVILRALVFMSSLPITVAMNSVRIAVTGILADSFGLAAAEGFFHYFEGWAVFCLCLALLAIEMKAIALLDGRGRSLVRRLDLELPKLSMPGLAPAVPQLLAIGALLLITVLGGIWVQHRIDVAEQAGPTSRATFSSFPRKFDQWVGFEAPVDARSIEVLKPTDYLSVSYHNSTAESLDLWIAYYSSGAGYHSPLICIPGGGWEIERLDKAEIPLNAGAGKSVTVNRIIIRRGTDRQLVYYWFQGRGRIEADEGQARLLRLIDAFRLNRKDQALVRLTAPLSQGVDIAAVDSRLQAAGSKLIHELQPFIP